MSVIDAYAHRLKEKDSDFLFLELAEARTANATTAIELLEAELHNRGLRTDEPRDER